MATNENKIFDKETLLDLTVNFVPLFIILFFIGVLLITNPWPDLGGFLFIVALGLHVIPFVGLAILTYVSGKAIAGDEKTKTVFPPGQATVPGTAPMTHEEAPPAPGSPEVESGVDEAGAPEEARAVEAGETDSETDRATETGTGSETDRTTETGTSEPTDGDGDRSA